MRWRIVALVILIHVLAVVGLIRAFTPQFTASVVRTVTSAFTVAAPSASRSPPPPSSSPSDTQGKAGAPGKKARPKPETARSAPIALKPTQVSPLAGQGSSVSGAARQGESAGASGNGQGTGSGAGGNGQGGGGKASPTVKIEGDISSAKDYPRAGRDLRIGTSVTIDLAVGTDGRVKSCRIVQPSPDAEADGITCELAIRRFRFRPAYDFQGNPVQATYRWRQRWFY